MTDLLKRKKQQLNFRFTVRAPVEKGNLSHLNKKKALSEWQKASPRCY